ncbi:MAG: exodeoxyribonuclease VII small subunit [bacterium]|nr:exodeoxyribonuclease VII small subunit [bacterium]
MAEKNATFEDNLRRLEDVVGKLEQGELPLDDAIKLYQEGMRLSKLCAERLASVEAEIKKLVVENDNVKLETLENPDA